MDSHIKTENIEPDAETEIKEEGIVKEEQASDPEYSIDNLPPLIENDVKSEIESDPQGTTESTQIKTVDDKIASSFGKFTQVSPWNSPSRLKEMVRQGLEDPFTYHERMRAYKPFQPELARDWFLKNYEQSTDPGWVHGIRKKTLFNTFLKDFKDQFEGTLDQKNLFVKQINLAVESNAELFHSVETKMNNKGIEKFTNLKLKAIGKKRKNTGKIQKGRFKQTAVKPFVKVTNRKLGDSYQ